MSHTDNLLEIKEKYKRADFAFHQIAAREHYNQKYGEKDYTWHLLQVQDTIKTLISDEYRRDNNIFELDCLYTIAFLHDVFEDTEYNKKYFYIDFKNVDPNCADFIYTQVMALTIPKGTKRSERDYSPLKNKLFASICKMADRIANVEACLETGNKKLFIMYLNERKKLESCLYNDKLVTPFLNWADALYHQGQVKFGLLQVPT